MLDLKKGEIILCQSGFRINRKTTPEDLEKNIPDLIHRRFDAKSGYYWYYCWLDVEPGQFFGAGLCFKNKKLLIMMDLYPSNIKDTPRPNDYMIEHEIDEKWLRQYQETDDESYRWGRVRFIRGDWDFSTRIIVSYNVLFK